VKRSLLVEADGGPACIPSKTLLRPPEVWGEPRRAFGTSTPTIELA
jgi:hypothetical protein